jgi:DNA-binding NarL/FixJ family response regulator
MTVTAVSATSVAVIAADPQRRLRIETAAETLGRAACSAAGIAALPEAATDAAIFLMALGGDRAADTKAIAQVRDRFPEARVLLVLPAPCNRDRRFAGIGADGIVYETELERMLAPALSALESGLAVLPQELNADHRGPKLSAREKQVLAMVVMGYTNIEIATKLYLAESTVKSHLSSSFRKLGVNSRNDAAARILDPHSGLGPGILAISGEGLASLAGQGADENGSAAS